MKELISLLKLKNDYMKKFLLLNKSFKSKMLAHDFSDLDLFEENRKKIINILAHFDKSIAVITQAVTEPLPQNSPQRQTVSALLDIKDEMVKQIIDIDLEILSLIDGVKDQIIKELRTINEKKKTLNSYGKVSRLVNRPLKEV